MLFRSFNKADKQLAISLDRSHRIIEETCQKFEIPCQILAPTLVYGEVDGFRDKNISTIIDVMRRVPVIFLPHESGLRQPIHATQLAKVALKQAKKISGNEWDQNEPSILTIGGDEIISYQDMLLRIRNNLNMQDKGKDCKILGIPEKVFYLLVAPTLPIKPKLFEALLRVQSNLSGFMTSSEILGEAPKSFPVLPLPK